jgi:hypothetical protein
LPESQNQAAIAKNQGKRCFETSAKPSINRSGVSAERRKILEIEECGFLPKAATSLLQRSQNNNAAEVFPAAC